MSKADSNIALLIHAEVRRTAWDLGKHLTLFASAAALVALFFYIFKDFVGEQIASFSPELARNILKFLSLLVSAFAGITAASTTAKLSVLPRSLIPMMKRVGSPDDALKKQSVAAIMLPLMMAALFSGLWSLLLKADNILASVLTSIAVGCVFRFFNRNKSEQIVEPTSAEISNGQKDAKDITDWRRHQLLRHKMPGKGLMKLAMVGGVLLPVASLAHPHHFLLGSVALCVGLVASFGIIYAVAADLPGSWFEKQAGLTHADWLNSWQRVATTLALILMLCGLTAFALVPANERTAALALPVLPAFTVWLTPSLVLQIDGRAKSANLLVMILVGLFIGTAMMATPWAALVIPILKSQAAGYQNSRFYRA